MATNPTLMSIPTRGTQREPVYLGSGFQYNETTKILEVGGSAGGSLTAGTGVSFVGTTAPGVWNSNTENATINAATTTLASTPLAIGQSLVSDGTGPTLAVRPVYAQGTLRSQTNGGLEVEIVAAPAAWSGVLSADRVLVGATENILETGTWSAVDATQATGAIDRGQADGAPASLKVATGIQVVETGLYHVSFSVQCEDTNTEGYFGYGATSVFSGVSTAIVNVDGGGAVTDRDSCIHGSRTVWLDGGTVYGLYINAGIGGTVSAITLGAAGYAGGTYFSIHRVA